MSMQLSNISTDATLVELEIVQKLCSKLMETKHFAKLGPEGTFAIVQIARAIGIDPMEALNGALYYVQGKVGMSSEMMNSLIRQKGHSITKNDKSDDKICILHGKRRDSGDTWTCTFSMDDAKRAGLAKNMYDKFPSVMIYNRCMSMLARQLFPDIIKGAGYTEDELIEIKNSTFRVEEPIKISCDKIVEVKKEVISDEDAKKLSEMLIKCPIEFQNEILSFCKKSNIGEDLKGLPAHFFERLTNRIKRELENVKIHEEIEILETEEIDQ